MVDDGEEPAEAAIRELGGENGYRDGRGEHLGSCQPTAGRVDGEHVLFVGQDPERVGVPTEVNEAARMEWVPLASVRELISAGDIWNASSLVALLCLLAFRP